MNTIFDKIKRGVIETSNERVFNRIDYYKRPELIKPYLHYIDNNRLQDNIEKHMGNHNNLSQTITKHFGRNKKIDKDQMFKDAIEFYHDDFPAEVAADIFNMYQKDPSKLDYADRDETNKFRYKILDNVIDPVGRVITKDSNVKSMIMTKNMVEYFSLLMAYQKQVDQEAYEDMKNQMNGGGDGQGDQEADGQDQDADGQESKQGGGGQAGKTGSGQQKQKSPEEILEKLMQDKSMQALQEELVDNAKKQIQGIGEVVSDEELEEAWATGGGDATFSKEEIQQVQKEYEKMTMNMGSVQGAIKKLLDKTSNYFTGKEIVEYNSIFDSDSLEGLQDYELLHPKLRKLMIDDITVKNSYREGKIDLYMDISGSMDESFSYNGTYITKLDFAKAFAIQMIKMGIVNKLYTFNTRIHPLKASLYSILLVTDAGGTQINTVVEEIERNKQNAIILTDAEDHCSAYSDYAFFIGVEGCRFNYFNEEVIRHYSENNQVVKFDGTGIHKIYGNGTVYPEL